MYCNPTPCGKPDAAVDLIIQSACDILIYNLNEAETVPEGEGRQRRTEKNGGEKHEKAWRSYRAA